MMAENRTKDDVIISSFDADSLHRHQRHRHCAFDGNFSIAVDYVYSAPLRTPA